MLRRSFRGWTLVRPLRSPVLRLLGQALLVVMVWCGCQREVVHVELTVSPNGRESPPSLIIEAKTSKALSDLEYVWFAETGKCSPQYSSSSVITEFQFADGSSDDRVTVEVWRKGERIALNDIRVNLAQIPVSIPAQAPTNAGIEITRVPLAATGGPDTHTEIGGRVTGVTGKDYRVVVYALSKDTWYVQPHARSVLAIDEKRTWSTWTHSGSAYAALVVVAGYVPARTLTIPPPLGKDVLARTIVRGREK